MGFTALSASRTQSLFRHLGDACTLTPQGGDPIPTFGILEQRTAVVGALGQLMDERPSIELLRADVGQPRRAEIQMTTGAYAGKTYDIDQPMPLGANSQNELSADDGLIVRYYLRERSDG